MDFTIHPDVYVIDDKGNKYTNISQLNIENEVYKNGYYFYIVAEIKNNDFCFTYKINATFCTQKHNKKYDDYDDYDDYDYDHHMGESVAKDFYDVLNHVEKDRIIIFPIEGKRTHSSKIVIKDGFITFSLIVASNSGHDSYIDIKLTYDDNMKWMMKSIAYFFTFIDFTDEE